MEKILSEFVGEIKNKFEDKLYSIILYGSKVNNEAVENFSDYNILILFNDLKFDDLKFLSFIIKKWVKKGNSCPVIFSTQRFKMSSDVFPIEFMDMKQNHKVLYGKDVFDEIDITEKNLRHQCEYELKSNLLKLRKMYMLNVGNNKQLVNILVNSLTSFLVVFKSILYLTEKNFPIKKVDALNLLSKKINFDITPFLVIMKLKEKNKEVGKIDIEKLVEKYVTELEKIVDFVDNLKVE
jgi:hypothetical protein